NSILTQSSDGHLTQSSDIVLQASSQSVSRFSYDIVLWESGRDRQQLIGTLQQALTTVSFYARLGASR
ncbi:hypothetical protein BgiMline_034398, partial [Biomphalaria glabrata]